MTKFVEKHGSVEAAKMEIERQAQRYKYLELSFEQERDLLKKKIPENEKLLEAVKFLQSKEEEDIQATFPFSAGMYANAVVKKPASVCLWLGANVMLEYPFEEAASKLADNVRNCQAKLEVVERDLAFAKDQFTILQVSMARVHNHFILEKKKKALLAKN